MSVTKRGAQVLRLIGATVTVRDGELYLSMPASSVAGFSQLTAEIGLHFAILDQAVRDITREHRTENHRRAFRDAWDWVFGEEEKDQMYFSFEAICETFHLDPLAVRAQLRPYGLD